MLFPQQNGAQSRRIVAPTRRELLQLLGMGCALGTGGALLAGCGGGGNDPDTEGDRETITTETRGILQDISIAPRPGDAFLSRATAFEVAWNNPNAPAPARWQVELRRYREARGDDDREISSQRIRVNRIGDGQRWSIARTDDFDLDSDGVYYLQLNDDITTYQIAYIVDNRRGVSDAVSSRAVTVSPGTSGLLSNVQIAPAPGASFIRRSTDWLVRWPDNAPPPPEVRMEIHRYSEAIGGEGRRDDEQESEMERVPEQGQYAYRLRRRDNFDLDSNGVYYLRFSAPGQATYYAVYIIGDF